MNFSKFHQYNYDPELALTILTPLYTVVDKFIAKESKAPSKSIIIGRAVHHRALLSFSRMLLSFQTLLKLNTIWLSLLPSLPRQGQYILYINLYFSLYQIQPRLSNSLEQIDCYCTIYPFLFVFMFGGGSKEVEQELAGLQRKWMENL